MEPKFLEGPVIASLSSQRLEGKKREQKERIVTRSVAVENEENPIKQRIGPPAKKSELAPKKVVFEESLEEVPRTNDKVKEVRAKGKLLPYVDIPPLKAILRSPVTTPVKEDQPTKIGPAYKSRAPVEVGIDIEKIVESVLDLEISVPLRSLAGVSGHIQKEIRKQVTRSRVPTDLDETSLETLPSKREKVRLRVEDIPISSYVVLAEESDEIPEGSFVADDPILQYLSSHKEVELRELVVGKTSEPLRAIYATVNRVGQEECLMDNGSMIVSMARETAIQFGLTWDPTICIEMESASNHVEKTLGLARNVRFSIGGVNVYLQVHILADPPYKILLGRPFDTFTSSVHRTKTDGTSEVVITDPNTKLVANVPTYRRGQGPEELQKQRFQGF
jgi:hypothetical protein